jgi:tetratricopeptide (TPR) repeat protein
MPPQGREETVARLDRILERAPNFARALGARAYARAWLNFQVPSAGGHEAVLRDAERALALAPDLAEPRVARAVAYWSSSGGWRLVEAVRELETAIARNPGLQIAHLDLSRILYHCGWMVESERALETARRLNPASSEVIRGGATITWFSGDPGAGLAEFRELPPGVEREGIGGRWQILHARLLLEDPEPLLAEAEAWVAEGPSATPLPLALLAVARVRSGSPDIRDLEAQIESADRRIGHFHHVDHLLAEAYAQKGDAPRAVEHLRRAATSGFPCPVCFETDPLLAPIRSSPAYAAFREELVRQQEGLRGRLKGVL